MELLVTLLGEFLIVLALPALVILAELLLALFGLLFEGACALLQLPFRTRPGFRLKISPGVRRRIRVGILAAGGLGAVLLLLAQTVLFEPILRFGLSRVEGRSGLSIAFESAEGNWLTGRVHLRNVTMRREDAVQSSLNFSAREVEIDTALPSLGGPAPRFESVAVRGLSGVYRRGSVPSRRLYRIDRWALEDATVELVETNDDGRRVRLPLRIERMESAPLRGEFAVFDALFRSTLRGSIEGAPFEVRSAAAPGGRTTSWHATGLPARFLAEYVGEPFDWLKSGRVDVDVEGTWANDGAAEIDLRWKVVLSDLRAEAPPRITGLKRTVAGPVVSFLNANPGRLPLEFTLKVSEEQFRGTPSIEAVQLWDAAADALTNELARRVGLTVEFARKGVEKFRKFFDGRNKNDKNSERSPR